MAAGSRLGAYVSGALLVRLADEGARVGLLLLAIERTGSPGLGGLLVAALLIPHVVAAPMVGLLTDRARRPQLVIAGAAAGFGLAFAAAAVTLGSISSILVAALPVAGGCCGPALTGALTSQLAALVPESRLPRAFGIDSLVYNVAGIGGPALAAVLATITSALSATLILAGAAVLGGVIIAVLPIKARAASISRLSIRDLNGGIAAILRQPVLATVTAATTAGQLGAGGIAVIAALLAAEQNNPAAVGWLLTSMAAGALIGSLLWTWRPAAVDRAPSVVMIMLIATGLPLVALAWSPSTVFRSGVVRRFRVLQRPDVWRAADRPQQLRAGGPEEPGVHPERRREAHRQRRRLSPRRRRRRPSHRRPRTGGRRNRDHRRSDRSAGPSTSCTLTRPVDGILRIWCRDDRRANRASR